MRTGIVGQKLGMTRVFDDDGRHVPVTVISLEGCQVVAQRTREKDGYTALQLGAGARKAKNTSKALRGHFAKAQVEPKRKLAEFRVSDDALVEVGSELVPGHFVTGQFVDVTSTSIGKGFAGVMKRHNFRGLRATHGVSVSHRSGGSTGQCQDPGRVFKGKKMAGQMGAKRVTVQNLMVARTLDDEGLILIRGAVPGAEGSWVLVTDALKKQLPDDAPFPAGLREDAAAKEAEEAESAEAAEAEAAEESADKAKEEATSESAEDDKAEAKAEEKPEKTEKDETPKDEKKAEAAEAPAEDAAGDDAEAADKADDAEEDKKDK